MRSCRLGEGGQAIFRLIGPTAAKRLFGIEIFFTLSSRHSAKLVYKERSRRPVSCASLLATLLDDIPAVAAAKKLQLERRY